MPNQLDISFRRTLPSETLFFQSYPVSIANKPMFPCRKLRHLEELLQSLQEFERPKVYLEQYITPPHLASHMLHTIQTQFGDIENKLVADFGAGCGTLTLGAAALAAASVIAFEVDEDALSVFRSNKLDLEIANCDAIQCNVLTDINDRFFKLFDTVIMNPPFGTKNNAGIDMAFLQNALQVTNNVVYSLHKTSTRKHVLKVAKSQDATGKVLAELRYDLPPTYKFHKKSSVDIQVDFIRFTLDNTESNN